MLETYKKDPYVLLAQRHKVDYTYSLEKNENGVDFLVRKEGKTRFIRRADPTYKTLEIDNWSFREYNVDDELEEEAIVGKEQLLENFKTKFWSWITTRKRQIRNSEQVMKVKKLRGAKK
jgi:hypothetical protein